MGDDDNRAAGVDRFAHQRHHLCAGRRIEGAGRLVRPDDIGFADQGSGNCDSLLLAAGEVGRYGVAAPTEADLIEDARRGGADRGCIVAAQDERQLDVLGDRSARATG